MVELSTPSSPPSTSVLIADTEEREIPIDPATPPVPSSVPDLGMGTVANNGSAEQALAPCGILDGDGDSVATDTDVPVVADNWAGLFDEVPTFAYDYKSVSVLDPTSTGTDGLPAALHDVQKVAVALPHGSKSMCLDAELSGTAGKAAAAFEFTTAKHEEACALVPQPGVVHLGRLTLTSAPMPALAFKFLIRPYDLGAGFVFDACDGVYCGTKDAEDAYMKTFAMELLRRSARTWPADLRTGVGTMLAVHSASASPGPSPISTHSLDAALDFQLGITEFLMASPTRCSTLRLNWYAYIPMTLDTPTQYTSNSHTAMVAMFGVHAQSFRSLPRPPWVFARVFRTWVLLIAPLSLLYPPDMSSSSCKPYIVDSSCTVIVYTASDDQDMAAFLSMDFSSLPRVYAMTAAPHNSINIHLANSQKYCCIFHIPVSADRLLMCSLDASNSSWKVYMSNSCEATCDPGITLHYMDAHSLLSGNVDDLLLYAQSCGLLHALSHGESVASSDPLVLFMSNCEDMDSSVADQRSMHSVSLMHGYLFLWEWDGSERSVQAPSLLKSPWPPPTQGAINVIVHCLVHWLSIECSNVATIYDATSTTPEGIQRNGGKFLLQPWPPPMSVEILSSQIEDSIISLRPTHWPFFCCSRYQVEVQSKDHWASIGYVYLDVGSFFSKGKMTWYFYLQFVNGSAAQFVTLALSIVCHGVVQWVCIKVLWHGDTEKSNILNCKTSLLHKCDMISDMNTSSPVLLMMVSDWRKLHVQQQQQFSDGTLTSNKEEQSVISWAETNTSMPSLKEGSMPHTQVWNDVSSTLTTNDLRVPWDPGICEVLQMQRTAWGQAVFQGGKYVMILP